MDVLDDAHRLFLQGDVDQGMREVRSGLLALRSQMTGEMWRDWVEAMARRHPLRELLHQCPMTRRAFDKPRGYPGDAVLLDYIYGTPVRDGGVLEVPEALGPFSEAIYHHCYSASAPRAVRERRKILAKAIDQVATQRHRPRILSIACGHLREAQLTQSLPEGLVEIFYALDHDPETLAVVEKELAHFGVRPIHARGREILTGKVAFSDLDLIYASGLLDYLEDQPAQRLLERMLAMLRTGGRLLVTNFLPDIEDVGYMEAFMDWWLLYRTIDEMEQLAAGLPEDQVSTSRTFIEENHNIVFLEVERG